MGYKKLIILFLGFVLSVGGFFSGALFQEIYRDNFSESSNLSIVSDQNLFKLESEKLWSLVQKWRVDNGLRPYEKDQRLCDLASARLREISTDFSHKGMNDRWNAGYQATIQAKRSGENLAKDFLLEQEVLDGWIKSPSHLENLQDNYSHSCIKTDGRLVVHEFANF